MKKRRLLPALLVLVTGAMPLVTMGTCYNEGGRIGYDLYSTNSNLAQDVFDLLFEEDDD
jgi:hypothetical protein